MAARRPELRLGERERSRRDIAGALVAERTVPPLKKKAFNKQNSLFLIYVSDFLGRHQESMRKCKKVRQSSTLVCVCDFQAFMGVQRFTWRRSREVKRSTPRQSEKLAFPLEGP